MLVECTGGWYQEYRIASAPRSVVPKNVFDPQSYSLISRSLLGLCFVPTYMHCTHHSIVKFSNDTQQYHPYN